MSIYMKLDGNIKGNVTTKGYEDWIELSSINLNFIRNITTQVGNTNNRQTGGTKISEITIHKPCDASSCSILTYMLTEKIFSKVTISLCNSEKQVAEPNVSFELDNVLISAMHETARAESSVLYEEIKLNFTKFEKSFFPKNKEGKMGTPMRIIFDLEKGTVI